MTLMDRRSVLIALPCLAACGFEPVYGPGGSAEALRGRITFDPPRDSEGFALVRALEDRLGRPDTPEYLFTADIRVSEDELGITPADEITRYNVLGQVTFRVVDATGDQVTGGTVDSFTAYSGTGTPVSTRVAREDARDRLMVILADKIVARLLSTSADWRA